MMLAISLVLGILPLLGVAWTLMNGMITTVDGLFMSLILITLSGVFPHGIRYSRDCATGLRPLG